MNAKIQGEIRITVDEPETPKNFITIAEDDEDHKRKEDSYYFSCYGSADVHTLMLTDVGRMNFYKNAILNNSDMFKGKVVVDIGCGTGVLSIFAARAGAKKVYAIEANKSLAKCAKNTVEKSKDIPENVIDIRTGRAERVSLPEGEKVDVIVSEWMGYSLLYEQMMSSVLAARDKWRPEVMMPNGAQVYIGGWSDEDYYKAKLAITKEHPYGLSFKFMKKEICSQIWIEQCPEENVATTFSNVVNIDLNKIGIDGCSSFQGKMDLVVNGGQSIEHVHGFVVYFDVIFTQGKKRMELSTSPFNPLTHWKQSILVLPVSMPHFRVPNN